MIKHQYDLKHTVAVAARKIVLARHRAGLVSENVANSVVEFPPKKSLAS
jgi:hypothetical protein